MKTIKLKSLSLINFKGIRELELQFTDQTTICGGNGTGKTTIFDSFTWLLFGKDSTGRSDSNFSIKTIDPETGKPYFRLEHSVTAVLDVNGSELKLQRVYKENWVKPRGTTKESLKNHETEFYVNDVKMGTKKEYEAVISDVMSEELFRMVTNPFCFSSLKPEEQKNILLDMVGCVSDEEISVGNPDFEALLANLSGRTLAQFAREISAKKRACKDVLAVIPSQIETAKRLTPEEQDWAALEKELEAKKKSLADIDQQIADKSKVAEAENNRRLDLRKEIGRKELALSERESEIKAELMKGINDAQMAINKKGYEIESISVSHKHMKEKVARSQGAVDAMEKHLSALRDQYRRINSQMFRMDKDALICPTCKRMLEPEDADAKRQEMIANFNENKAHQLKINKEEGQAAKKKLDDLAETLKIDTAKLEEIRVCQENLEAQKKEMEAALPEQPNVGAAVAADPECIRLKNLITDLNNQLQSRTELEDFSDLTTGKETIQEGIQELYSRLAGKKQIERAKHEIEELEEKRISNNQTLADLEKMEFTAVAFQKAKDEALQQRINGLFNVVSFSFVSDQLNGGEKLTCVCTVNGTPYPDANSASKLNAGIDIINALCQTKGVSAPIFIDNRESVNEIIPTISQVINLVVSNDNQLIVK